MLPPGTQVETINAGSSDDWTEEAKRTRRFGVKGIVIGHHDSHGLCYCVAHFRSGLEGGNSTIAYYEPQELRVLAMPIPMTPRHFPVYEKFEIKEGETPEQSQRRWMIESFAARRHQCRRVRKVDNADSYAGQPMVYYCEHCDMLCDILSEDFICAPRKACSMCEFLIKYKVMEEAKQYADAR